MLENGSCKIFGVHSHPLHNQHQKFTKQWQIGKMWLLILYSFKSIHFCSFEIDISLKEGKISTKSEKSIKLNKETNPQPKKKKYNIILWTKDFQKQYMLIFS